MWYLCISAEMVLFQEVYWSTVKYYFCFLPSPKGNCLFMLLWPKEEYQKNKRKEKILNGLSKEYNSK